MPEQSASQLSEGIGDVLASIRKLIAQDEEALTPALARPCTEAPKEGGGVRDLPRLAGTGGEGAASLRPLRSEAVAAQRRDILAEAQTLNRFRDDSLRYRESQAADAPDDPHPSQRDISGRDPDLTRSSPSLPLPHIGPATDLAAQAGECRAGIPEWFGDETPLVLSRPLPPLRTAPAAGRGPNDRSGEEGLQAGSEAGTPKNAAAEQPEAIAPAPPGVTGGAALLEGDVRGAPQVTPSALATCGDSLPAAAVPDTDFPLPETEMNPVPIPLDTSVANSPAQPAAAMAQSSDAARDEFAASILSTMIRDVVRSELQEGGMARDLRAIILREVAQALTGADRIR